VLTSPSAKVKQRSFTYAPATAIGPTGVQCSSIRWGIVPILFLCLQLLKHLDGLIKEEAERGWKPPEGQESSCVLGSANQLFLKIRASLNRCVKLVSRGSTLLRLSSAFKVCVQSGCMRHSNANKWS
jgi:hypothetical protein